MPIFDSACEACGWYSDCVLVRRSSEPNPPCPQCGGATYRPWRGKMANIIPDEFVTPLVDDVMTKDVQTFYSRSEHRRAMKEHGVVNLDRHMPVPGTDKSEHTTRWDVGWPPGYDPRPMAHLSPEEQAARRKEWLRS